MTEWEWRLAETLTHWLMAWSVVVLGVVALIAGTRPQRPAVRYAGWLWATYSGVLLLLLVGGLSPVTTWSKVGEWWTSPPVTAAKSPVAVSDYEPLFDIGNLHVPAASLTPVPADVSAAQPPAVSSPRVGLEARASVKEVRSARGVMTGVIVIWVIGTAAGILRLACGVWRAYRLIRAADRPVSAELEGDFAHIRRELGIRRDVHLRCTEAVDTPVCVGLWGPVVLWPGADERLRAPRDRQAALRHELSHLARYDDWVTLTCELWRALCWFYLPIHWLIGRIRREQEYLSDDVAAGALGRSQPYARLLLNLSQVRVSGEMLCSPFTGGKTMASRIERLLRSTACIGLLRLRSKVALGAAAALLLSAAGGSRLIGLVDAGEQRPYAELPPITAAELGQKMTETIDKYLNGVVEGTFTRTVDLSRVPNAGKDQVTFPGQFRYASDGTRWRGELESKTWSNNAAELYSRRRIAGYDGSRHYRWHLDLSSRFVIGEFEAEILPFRPDELFWSIAAGYAHKLRDGETDRVTFTVTGQQTVDGYRCYVLRSSTPDKAYETEALISPRQSYLAVRFRSFHKGEVYLSNELHDLQQDANGNWYPRRIVEESSVVAHEVTEITAFDPERTFAASYFEQSVPWNLDVEDRITGETYHNDPWWPDIHANFPPGLDWPRTDFVALRNAESYADPSLAGQPAPPLRVNEWILGEPMSLADRRGKPTLLYFSTASLIDPEPEWLAALREFHRRYQPFGLEVIGIVSARTDVKTAKRNLEELRIPFSVAIDSPGEGQHGKTFDAYRLKTYMSVVLVDHRGNVRLVGPGQLGGLVNRLLTDAGVRAAPPLSLDSIERPREVDEAVKRIWPALREVAPNTGMIIGTVIGPDGPIAGATVEARLSFRMLFTTAPGGHMLFPLRERTWDAVSDEAGIFALSPLYRGTYDLTFHAPGKARLKRQVTIEPSLAPVDIEVSLAHGDSITGLVRDAAGSAVAGAQVRLIKHHHHPERTHPYTQPVDIAPVRSDANGRFHRDGLFTGAYTLEITADGFETRIEERVPSGTQNVVVTLSKADN